MSKKCLPVAVSLPKTTCTTHLFLASLLLLFAQPALAKATFKPSTFVANHAQVRKVRITLDPGHGGKDPGSISGRYVEKKIVLEITKNLQSMLNQHPMFQAQLTRSSDRFLSLRKRSRIARAQQADLFIAIHADNFPNPRAHGVSIFSLSDKGASSEAARWLAEKDNHSELLGGTQLDSNNALLRSVILDLEQNASIKTALDIGHNLLTSLKTIAHLHSNVTEQAAFVVLKSPDIPSLLIEVGFISNPLEARRLTNPKYQKKLAHSIAYGIWKYYRKHPLYQQPTMQAETLKHVVIQPGDTLYSIARSANIPVWKLKKANHLHGQVTIHSGQTLLIPKADTNFITELKPKIRKMLHRFSNYTMQKLKG
jgi:N-acetylmuramoyl-L-alanine amidase